MTEKRPADYPYPMPGALIPWKVAYRNLEYQGEVMRASAWQPDLGRETRTDFRLVLLAQPQRVPPESIARENIALFIPSARALRERPEPYGTPDFPFPRGRVLTRKGAIAIAAPFQEYGEALNLMASSLLAQAYPSLPLDTSSLPGVLTSEVVGHLLDGLLGMKEAKIEEALVKFGPALRLAPPEQMACPAFPIILNLLEAHEGEVSISELYDNLCGCGLPRSLATLYLVSFLVQGRPATEMVLKDKVFGLERLSLHTLPQLKWQPGLEDSFVSLHLLSLWERALPYAAVFQEELRKGAKAAEGEKLLLEKLREWEKRLPGLADLLSRLASRLGPAPGPTQESLERLGRLTQARDLQQCLSLAEELYGEPQPLAQGLKLLLRLRELEPWAPDIMAVRAYLDGVALAPEDEGLAVDRASLLEQMALDNLLAQPQLWPSIKALFQWFRSRYRSQYLAQHRSYHQELSVLKGRLEEAEPELAALARLNTLEALGPPLGEALSPLYAQLKQGVHPCPQAEARLDLEDRPTCLQCGFQPIHSPPSKEVDAFLKELRTCLQAQQGRLSSEAIRQLLTQERRDSLDTFLKVVQASDVSALARTLNDEVVAFLRRLLAEANVHVEPFPLGELLREKFGSLAEGGKEEVLAETRKALDAAFQRAKEEHPGKRIRLQLT